MNLILIGPQGSGKTTQAHKIANRYRLTNIEVGELIRQKASTHSQKADLIDHLANQKGKLIPDGLAINILFDQLYIVGFNNLLLDGFPRTVNQYYALVDLFRTQNTAITACIYLKLDDEEAITRVQNRRICPICHQTYNLLLEPNRTNCSCSSPLIKRQDDEPQAIASRLQSYHTDTAPILEQLKKDNLLIEIDGNKGAEAVFADITKALDQHQNIQAAAQPEAVPPSAPTLFIMTHAESAYNKDNVFTGRLDSKLTEEGQHQSDLVAEILKNEHIDIAYQTTLTRTQETLQRILKYHPETQVVTDDRFIERDYGELAGLSKTQYKQDHPELFPTYHRSYDVAPPGGESVKQVEERVLPALEEVINRIKHDKVNVLMVVHANSIRPIRRYFENLTPEEMMDLEHLRHQIFTYKIQV